MGLEDWEVGEKQMWRKGRWAEQDVVKVGGDVRLSQ